MSPTNAIHRYNRILDLKRFRMMTMDGRIPAKGFVTFHSDGNDVALLGESRTENDIIEFFKPYSHTQASTKPQRSILICTTTYHVPINYRCYCATCALRRFLCLTASGRG